jgi:chromate transporter
MGAAHPVTAQEESSATSLWELARVFGWLGTVAFGGPAAHIAMMRHEVVERRRWLNDQRFLDLLGAVHLIPGPNSTELAIHIGFERRRFVGLVVAGLAFIVPAMLITGALGYVYVRYHALPQLGAVFYGVKPVIVAVVAHAIVGLAPTAARTLQARVLAALALVLALAGSDELLVLFATGTVAALFRRKGAPLALLDASFGFAAASGAGAVVHSASLPSLFGVFVKIGSVLFGSGYVLLSFLRRDLVERLGWLTEGQLLDAVAVGQVTPGPVFTTATFIGYILRGPTGALVATAGIFLPAFFFVALSGPLIPRLRGSAAASSFLDGVNVASLALMVAVTVQLASSALIDVVTTVLALVSLVALVRFRVNATWLLLLGAVVGLIASRTLGLTWAT